MASHYTNDYQFTEVNPVTRTTEAIRSGDTLGSKSSRATRSSRANGDRRARMSRGWILETAKNPFENELKLSAYELVKRCIVAVTLFPLRLLIGSFSLLFLWLFAILASVCHPMEEDRGCYRHLKPMSRCRQRLFVRPMLFFIRCILWCFGIWRIRVNDQRGGGCCSTKELANIIVVGPHTSILDMFVIMYLFPGSGFAGQSHGLKIPLQRSISIATQGVFFDVLDVQSRKAAQDAIVFRASPDKWDGPPLSVYPEGTITNGRQLIQFRAGAFAAGEPVLPVILQYPWHNYDPSWVGANRDANWAMRCMLQVVNYCHVEILDVYEPTQDEISNPMSYAKNVREMMAEEVNLPTTEHGYDDAFFYLEALFESEINSDFEVYEMKQVLNADMDQLHAWLEIFKKMDTERNGYLRRDQLCQTLQIADKHLANRLFNYFDTDGSGMIEYREFVQILAMLSGQCSKNSLAKLAFMIYDVDNRGAIPRAVISDALAGYDDEIVSNQSSIHSLEEVVVEPQKIGLLQEKGTNGKEKEEGDMNGNGNGANDPTVQWMWADAGLIGTKIIAEKNPFRWSKTVSVTKALVQLSRCPAEDQHRSVKVSHTWSSEMQKELATIVTAKVMEFESVEVAVIHLRKLEEARFLVGSSVTKSGVDGDLVTFLEFSKILDQRPELLEAIIGDLQSAARDLQPGAPKLVLDNVIGIHEGLPSPPLATVPCMSARNRFENAQDKAQTTSWSR